MENEIELYFKELIQKYDKDDIVLGKPIKDSSRLEGVPKVLHKLYEISETIELPFGVIYNVEEAKRQSQLAPFNPNWFVFGHDNYTSFWICTFEPNLEGLSFASWDHDIEEIDEPIDADIVSFFKDMEAFYGEDGMIPPFC